MSENNTEMPDLQTETNQAAKPETDAVNNSDTQKSDAVSEPPAKKAKQESRKNKGPHQSVDELAAAEAKAVCGSVDTSTGRQLRKREPPKVEPKKEQAKSKKEPATKKKEALVNKKEVTKKEPAGKRGRPKTKDLDEEKDSGSAAENSGDAEKEEEKVGEEKKEETKEVAEVAETKSIETDTKSVEEPKVVEDSTSAKAATTSEGSTSSNNAIPATAGSEVSPPKTE